MFTSVATLHTAGFSGFMSVTTLLDTRLAAVPAVAGVYAIVRDTTSPPVFLPTSNAGMLKGRNPSLAVAELEDAWVQNTCVLYLGKAGGVGNQATLRRRLSAYLRHGRGTGAPHWGGRAIWQLADAADLLVAWRVLTDEEPRTVERAMLKRFSDQFGRRPFANRTG